MKPRPRPAGANPEQTLDEGVTAGSWNRPWWVAIGDDDLHRLHPERAGRAVCGKRVGRAARVFRKQPEFGDRHCQRCARALAIRRAGLVQAPVAAGSSVALYCDHEPG